MSADSDSGEQPGIHALLSKNRTLAESERQTAKQTGNARLLAGIGLPWHSTAMKYSLNRLTFFKSSQVRSERPRAGAIGPVSGAQICTGWTLLGLHFLRNQRNVLQAGHDVLILSAEIDQTGDLINAQFREEPRLLETTARRSYESHLVDHPGGGP